MRRGDLVLVVTNPPSLPFVVFLAARLRRARIALRIEDVYPNVLVAAGMARPKSLLVRAIERATRALYRQMECVVVLGRDMAALAAEKLGDRAARMIYIPNWGDTESVRPMPRAENALLRELGIEHRFVVQYMGNMGRTHGVDALASAALRLRNRADLHFLFVGWGARKAALEETVRKERLGRVTVLPGCSPADLPSYANACDLSVIAFQPGMAGVSVPSRMYNVMAAGKPILAVADPESELARVVLEQSIGWVVPPDDLDALVAGIERAAATPAPILAAMQQRARQFVVSHHSKARVVEQYVALMGALEANGA